MSYYEKIPVIIEAWEMTKNNIIEMYSLVNKIHKEEITEQEKDKIIENSLVWGLDIPTLEDGEDRRAKHVASIGDYIIKGLQGEYYPVKPDIFKMSYRLVDDDNYSPQSVIDKQYGFESSRYAIVKFLNGEFGSESLVVIK